MGRATFSANYLSFDIITDISPILYSQSKQSHKKLCVQKSVKDELSSESFDAYPAKKIMNSQFIMIFVVRNFLLSSFFFKSFAFHIVFNNRFSGSNVIFFSSFSTKKKENSCRHGAFASFSKLHLNCESVVNYGIERM